MKIKLTELERRAGWQIVGERLPWYIRMFDKIYTFYLVHIWLQWEQITNPIYKQIQK